MKRLAKALGEKLRVDDSGSDDSDDEVDAGSPWTATCLQKPLPASAMRRDAGDAGGYITLTYSQHNQLGAPLKGWMVYSEKTNGSHPFSLEYKYFSMHEIMTGWNQYNWAPIDRWLSGVANRNHHGCFRVIVDYPNEYPDYRAPDFLKVRTNKYKAYGESGESPDYSDPNFRKALAECIAAMGQKFDGDSRIVAIEAGFLGYWGEWHMEKGFPGRDVQDLVQAAFHKAFSKTAILVSADALERENGPNLSRYRIGIHDDSYGGTTCEQCVPALTSCNMAGRWAHVMFGGELTYCEGGDQKSYFANDSGLKRFEQTLQAMPVSWLLNQGYFRYKGEMRERAFRAALYMGYQFHVASVGLHSNGITVKVVNKGTVPFYYPVWMIGSVNHVRTTSEFATNEALRYLTAGQSMDVFLPSDCSKLVGQRVPVRFMLQSTMVNPTLRIPFANVEDQNGEIVLEMAVNPTPFPYRPGAQGPPAPSIAICPMGPVVPPPGPVPSGQAGAPASGVSAAHKPVFMQVGTGKVAKEHTVKNLANQELTGTQDEWEKYVECEAEKKGFSAEITFKLPTGTSPKQLAFNFRGPTSKEQRWIFEVMDFKTQKWTAVADNAGAKGWVWYSKVTDLPPGNWAAADGQVRIRFSTDNKKDNCQLDYLALLA